MVSIVDKIVRTWDKWGELLKFLRIYSADDWRPISSFIVGIFGIPLSFLFKMGVELLLLYIFLLVSSSISIYYHCKKHNLFEKIKEKYKERELYDN